MARQVVEELSPETFSTDQADDIRRQLKTEGYAVVRDAATPAELEQLRSLLWGHLEGRHGWRPRQPSTWTDAAHFSERAARAGVLGDSAHCEAQWRARTLPGVLGSFAAAYGTDDLVASFDNMVVNRPASTAQLSARQLAEGCGGRWNAWWHAEVSSLHHHFNQDCFGAERFICYGILTLYDTSAATGTTAVVPRSSAPETIAAVERFREENAEELEHGSDPQRFLAPFTALGLRASPVRMRAGSLLLFDTGLFHSQFPAAEPEPHGTELRRAMCILSMCPRLLLSPTILRGRQLAYELGQSFGGSMMDAGYAAELVADHERDPAAFARRSQRRFAEASAAVRKAVGEDMSMSMGFRGAPADSKARLALRAGGKL